MEATTTTTIDKRLPGCSIEKWVRHKLAICEEFVNFYCKFFFQTWTISQVGKKEVNVIKRRTESQSRNSVTRKKSPNVYKSCPKMISLEKWMTDTFTKIA